MVKDFSHTRGFGLITPADGGEDVFFHHSAILRTRGRPTAVVGESVEFDLERVAHDVERAEKRVQAVRIRRIDPRLPLFRFADMGDTQVWLDQLAELAKDEPWDYSHISAWLRRLGFYLSDWGQPRDRLGADDLDQLIAHVRVG